jgi:iron complex transport system permease protein
MTTRPSGEVRHSRVIRSRGDRISLRFSPRVAGVGASITVVLVIVAIFSLYVGNSSVSAERVTEILLGDYHSATTFEIFAVLDVRLPRTLCAVLVGLAFGISGSLFQRVTGNPLGSPDIIGFTSGVATGAVAALAIGTLGVSSSLGGARFSIEAGAILGGLVSAALIYLLAWRGGLDGFRLILVGIGVSAVLSAIRGYILSRADLSTAQAGYRWLVGGLSGRDWSDVLVLVIGAGLLVVPTALLHRPSDRLSVGRELATTQGLAAGRWLLGMAAVGTAWIALAVIVAGPIGFVALAAPHVARLLTGRPGPHLLTSGLVGAALLAIADIISMRILAPTQLPTGVVTGILGGAYLLWLLQSRRRGLSS